MIKSFISIEFIMEIVRHFDKNNKNNMTLLKSVLCKIMYFFIVKTLRRFGKIIITYKINVPRMAVIDGWGI